MEYVCKNGTKGWWEVSGALLSDNRFLGFTSDTTERKLAKDALNESEYFFKESQKVSQTGSYKTDFIKGRWESSEVLDNIFGIDKEYERNVKGWLDIVYTDDREKMNDYLVKEVIGSRKSFDMEYRISRINDKEIRWVHGIGECSFNDKGEILSMIGTIKDINDRKLTEEIILKSEARLLNAVRIAKLGYWEYDIKNDMFTFNDSFYQIFHTTAEQEGGYKMSSSQYAERFVHPDDRAIVGIEIQKAMETYDCQYIGKIEHRIIYSDGNTGYINVLFSIVKDAEGNTIKTFGANQDITERVEVKYELIKAKEKAEESDRLKSAFSSKYVA